MLSCDSQKGFIRYVFLTFMENLLKKTPYTLQDGLVTTDDCQREKGDDHEDEERQIDDHANVLFVATREHDDSVQG